MMYPRVQNNAGFTFVELIVTIAVIAIFFSGLFTTVQLLLNIIGDSKATSGAVALATEQIEYIRSLPYSQVGTIGSPPYGSIPQNSTTTLNGVTYNERVLVIYIDDPADGLAGADSNAIIDDYKLVKVEYTWELRGETDSISLITTIVPNGIETTTGGGTIRVNVFDATVSPVESAAVHFVNDTLATTTDTIRYTNSEGVAFLSGAPAGANYRISVTKAGYSTDGTYVASTSNPNPVTPPVAVVESAVSTMNFQIDQTSDLAITTVSPATVGTWSDDFTTGTNIGTTSSTTLVSNAMALTNTLGVYDATGTVSSVYTTPSPIKSWETATFNATTSTSTSITVQVYFNDGGVFTLVPNSDLSGNNIGFTVSPIDLSGLSTTTYSTLALLATLESSDNAETPLLNEWDITHVISQSIIPNIDYRLFGAKSIGTDDAAQPVLKYDVDHTTDIDGESQLSAMEWDIYDFELQSGGYDIAEVCEPFPYNLDPGISESIQVTLVGASAQALKVLVTDASDLPIAGATVNLFHATSTIDQTSSTSLCGQTFFNAGLTSETDYTLTVSRPGYSTEIISDVEVTTSTSSAVVTLN